MYEILEVVYGYPITQDQIERVNKEFDRKWALLNDENAIFDDLEELSYDKGTNIIHRCVGSGDSDPIALGIELDLCYDVYSYNMKTLDSRYQEALAAIALITDQQLQKLEANMVKYIPKDILKEIKDKHPEPVAHYLWSTS
jgi:hypothetical protein